MKKFVFLISVTVLSAFAWNGSADENIDNQCIGQIAAAAASFQKLQGGKKFLFNPKVDKQLATFFVEVESLMKEVPQGTPPDSRVVQGMKAAYEKVTPIVQKSAAAELKACQDFTEAMAQETLKACPDFGKKPMSKEASDKCQDQAFEKNEVKAKYKKWAEFMAKTQVGS